MKVKTGSVFTRRDLSQVIYDLWSSGRFIDFKAEMITFLDEIVLTIDVDEIAGATPLGQPFSQNEKTLLKLRDWVGQQKGELTLEATSKEGSVEIIFDPQRGWIVRVSPAPDKNLSHVLILAGNSLTYVPPAPQY